MASTHNFARTLKVVTEHLPVEEIASIKHMFHMMDTNKNGKLTLEELKKGLDLVGYKMPEADAQMLMEAVCICISTILSS